jgi:plastocyanin
MKCLLVLLFIFIVACAPAEELPPAPSPVVQPQSAGNVIEITSSGFSPQRITINQGETVTWVNRNNEEHWPASAQHPTHRVYPTTGGCLGSTFDACKGLAQGEEWSFTFDEKGSWNYHDHLNPGLFGTVVVE